MATSEDGHYIRYQSSLVDADEPADTGIHHRAAGNLDHLADQYAQTRVRWVSHGAQHYTLDSALTINTTDYFLLWRSTPFDLHVGPMGPGGALQTYGMRCRVLANSSSGNVAIWAAVSLPDDALFRITAGEADAGSALVGAGSYAWTTLANLDDGGLLRLAEPQIRRVWDAAPTVDSIGGRVVGVPWIRASISVYGTSVSGGEPRIRGVELSEYVEP